MTELKDASIDELKDELLNRNGEAELPEYLWDEKIINGLSEFPYRTQLKGLDMRLQNIQYLLQEILQKFKEGD